jgi:methylated-DNA-[protein]-cysteine S-methyltransferase
MIYYYPIKIKSLNRTFLIAKNKKGVCNISFSDNEKKFISMLKLAFGEEVTRSKNKMGKEIKQIKDYFAGKRKEFNMKVFLKGTSFQTKVWMEIAKIKFGQTISYAELAKRIKNKNAVRAAGSACGKNPVPIVIPCHRVLASGSIGGFGGGIGLKKKMLKLENVL